MQSSSLACSANSFSPSPATVAGANRLRSPIPARIFSFTKSPLYSSQIYSRPLYPLHSTAYQENVETSKAETDFVEIGYISSVHGLQGEIRVKPKTDFEELRFSKPGKRWLRQRFSGREAIQEVELVEGRGHPGQKSWILRFSGIDTVDQAKFLVGSSILVREEDRPQLEDGEYYTRDLVGMKVVLKETGEPVGTVVNVFDSGGNDLLQVLLDISPQTTDRTGKPETEVTSSAPLVWIPFVEAIVPDVDMDKKEMLVTPPKGLLELNLRSDDRSKKERRQLEWKERKKFQRRLIAAKKKLCELEQQHVFLGFRHGEKAQAKLLADQIVSVNSKLLQQALGNVMESPNSSWNLSEFISVNSTNLAPNTLSIPVKQINPHGGKEKHDVNSQLREKGFLLTSQGKVAMVLLVDHHTTQWVDFDSAHTDTEYDEGSSYPFLQTILQADQEFIKLEDRASMPVTVVCPVGKLESLEQLFSEHDYFDFDLEKVWFLEEERLPVINSSQEVPKKHKILMKSPWEILQTPVGSGGVISLLSSDNILDNFSQMGVEYVEICSVHERPVGGQPLLLGMVDSRGADVGIQVSTDLVNSEETFDIIFSMKFMKKLVKHVDILQFHAALKLNSHVEKVDKEWVNVEPSSPNSYELRSSIYSPLKACSVDKVCVLNILKQ